MWPFVAISFELSKGGTVASASCKGLRSAHLTVRVPPILTTRRPGLLETLKLAAVQYIAFFLPIGFLLKCIHGSLFRFGIVAARRHHPVKQHYF